MALRSTKNKTKKTFYNAITSLLHIGVNSILSFLLVRVVLLNMGSDYNGLNSTTSQFLSIILILENSFTNAVQVALYKPYQNNDINTVNALCSKAKKTFGLCGVFMFSVGIVFAAIFAFFVKSAYDYITIFFVIAISVVSSVVASLASNKYRVLFQVSQDEYIVNLIVTLCNSLSQIAAFILVKCHTGIIPLRLSYAAFSVLQCCIICLVGRRMFKDIDFSMKENLPKIKGTKEVMVSVSVGIVYKSAPVFYLTSFLGTIYTSVFSVYKSIIGIVENVTYAILNSPKNAVGQILAGDDQNQKNRIVQQYEAVTVMVATVMLSVTFAVFIPFIKLYTSGITDVNYVDERIVFLMVMSSFVTFLHIPSGVCINLSGHFKLMQKNQLIVITVLIISMIVGGWLFKLYGILLAILITSVLLAFLEIVGARKYVVTSGYQNIIKLIFLNFFIGGILAVLGKFILSPIITNYVIFFAMAFLQVIATATIVFLGNYLVFKEDVRGIMRKVVGLLKKKIK